MRERSLFGDSGSCFSITFKTRLCRSFVLTSYVSKLDLFVLILWLLQLMELGFFY